MANPLQFDKFLPARPECQHCEELLADAVDNLETPGRLSPEDQALFDAHIATCDRCSSAFADAVRGAAWLQLLKSPRPEPAAHLLERIFAATSDAEAVPAQPAESGFQPLFERPVFHPNAAVLEPIRPAANVLPFRPRSPYLGRATRILFEPSRYETRLAMTAAMAFFSIALTLNITGVRLNQLHASDLKPSSLRRTYFETTAAVARRTESLRVVHVVEARVSDLRDARDEDDATPLGGIRERNPQPATQPATQLEEKPGAKPKPTTPDPNGVSRGTLAAPRFLPVTLRTRAPYKTGGLA